MCVSVCLIRERERGVCTCERGSIIFTFSLIISQYPSQKHKTISVTQFPFKSLQYILSLVVAVAVVVVATTDAKH